MKKRLAYRFSAAFAVMLLTLVAGATAAFANDATSVTIGLRVAETHQRVHRFVQGNEYVGWKKGRRIYVDKFRGFIRERSIFELVRGKLQLVKTDLLQKTTASLHRQARRNGRRPNEYRMGDYEVTLAQGSAGAVDVRNSKVSSTALRVESNGHTHELGPGRWPTMYKNQARQMTRRLLRDLANDPNLGTAKPAAFNPLADDGLDLARLTPQPGL